VTVVYLGTRSATNRRGAPVTVERVGNIYMSLNSQKRNSLLSLSIFFLVVSGLNSAHAITAPVLIKQSAESKLYVAVGDSNYKIGRYVVMHFAEAKSLALGNSETTIWVVHAQLIACDGKNTYLPPLALELMAEGKSASEVISRFLESRQKQSIPLNSTRLVEESSGDSFLSAVRRLLPKLCEGARPEPRNTFVTLYGADPNGTSSEGSLYSLMSGNASVSAGSVTTWIQESKFKIGSKTGPLGEFETTELTGQASRQKWRIDCRRKSSTLLSSVSYRADGSVSESFDAKDLPAEYVRSRDWVPMSAGEQQFRTICDLYGL